MPSSQHRNAAPKSRIRLYQAGALCLLLSASGCAINRVATVKKQFCDFEENFSYSLEDRPEFVFEQPAFYPGDINWVIGFDPTQTIPETGGYAHRYVINKAGGDTTGISSFSFDLQYEGRGDAARLKRVRLVSELPEIEELQMFQPEREITRVAGEICDVSLARSLRSMGVEDRIPQQQLDSLPTRERLQELLGLPSSESAAEGMLVYEYEIQTPSGPQPVMHMAIWYDEQGQKPLKMKARYRDMGSEADFRTGTIRHTYGG